MFHRKKVYIITGCAVIRSHSGFGKTETVETSIKVNSYNLEQNKLRKLFQDHLIDIALMDRATQLISNVVISRVDTLDV